MSTFTGIGFLPRSWLPSPVELRYITPGDSEFFHSSYHGVVMITHLSLVAVAEEIHLDMVNSRGLSRV
ncbi:MAG: hypothetical protein ACQET3_03120 [Promethearchaeati archaeon]